jgi:hypothetical protein
MEHTNTLCGQNGFSRLKHVVHIVTIGLHRVMNDDIMTQLKILRIISFFDFVQRPVF